MDDRETLEARFLGRDTVVLGVQCHCCVCFVHIVYSVIIPMMLSVCFIYSVVCILRMQFWV